MTQKNCGPWRRPYNWGLREDPITEDPKKNPINEKWNYETYAIKEDPQELQGVSTTFAPQKLFFSFLVMVYDRVDDGDKFSNESLGPARPRFYGTSHLKIETKVFFSWTLCQNVILEYHIKATVFLKSWIVAQIFLCK